MELPSEIPTLIVYTHFHIAPLTAPHLAKTRCWVVFETPQHDDHDGRMTLLDQTDAIRAADPMESRRNVASVLHAKVVLTNYLTSYSVSFVQTLQRHFHDEHIDISNLRCGLLHTVLCPTVPLEHLNNS